MNIHNQWEIKNEKNISNKRATSMKGLYRSLNATVEQPKNCPYGIDITIVLKNITSLSDNNDTIVICRGMFQLTSVSVLSDV
jgi:hypothetical protein